MTVIAWDGKTLAADKLGCCGDMRTIVKKIFRHNEVLLAITGDLSVGMEMLAWFQAGAAKDDFPKSNIDPHKGCSLIVIRHDATVWQYVSGPAPFRLEGALQAFGSGCEGALVAMHCGRNASQAVQLVSIFNSTCGAGVDTLELAV